MTTTRFDRLTTDICRKRGTLKTDLEEAKTIKTIKYGTND